MDNEENNKNEEEIIVEEAIDGGNSDFQEKFKKLEEKLTKCEELKNEYLNGWQRAKADLINARKDDEKKVREFVKFANAALISEILSVLDSFDLAFADKEQDSKFSKGIFLIKMQLEDILKKYGLEPIKTIGENADLNLHEIIGEIEQSRKEGIKEGVIIEELQKGYFLNGRVIRPARVKISKQI